MKQRLIVVSLTLVSAVALLLLLSLFNLLFVSSGQQPQVQEPSPQALQGLNAKWTNGVAPGYYPRCSPVTCVSTLTLSVGVGTCFDTSMVRHAYAGGTLTMTASSTNYIYLATATCALTQNTTGYPATNAIPLFTVTATSTITGIVDDRTWFGAASGGGGGGSVFTTYIPFDQCTASQTSNQGNSFWTVGNGTTSGSFTNWDAGHWELKFGVTATIWCSVRIPHNVAGTPNASVILDPGSADNTAGHTSPLNICDNITTSLNLQVGTLTCSSVQNYTTTTTAYSVTELSFAVNATVAADQILVVKIFQNNTGNTTQDIVMPPPKLKIDQTL